jgi:predicted metal-dependent enzyme (double-stranded beta helix superfamily)
MAYLDRPQLLELVGELAARPQEWESQVRHDPGRRNYELLRVDDQVMVWLICWMSDHDTGFHDHGLSAGAVAVVRGTLREERLRLGTPPLRRSFSAPGEFHFGAGDIHRVAHPGGEPAVSIHAYSPPLRRMGAYVVEPDGSLTRHSISHEEELRPQMVGV